MVLPLAIVWDPDPIAIHLGNFGVRYYSLLFAGGIFLGYLLVKRIMLREAFTSDQVERLVFYIVIATVVGARLGHCLFYEPEYYLKHPLEMILPFNFDDGKFNFTGYTGLASHGGIFAVFLSIWYFCRKESKSFLATLDKVSIGGALAGSFIRMGNFMNSEIIGKSTRTDFGVIFKKVDEVVRHPAQLYESVAYFAIFILLYFLYKKENIKSRRGFLFGLFFSLLFVSRFVLEYFKENQVSFEDQLFLNMGQLLSIPFIIGGLWVMYNSRKKSEVKP